MTISVHLLAKVRDAADDLIDLAEDMARLGNHPDAAAAARWLDHVGGVVAFQLKKAGALEHLPDHLGRLQ